jgi:hypothetical protein
MVNALQGLGKIAGGIFGGLLDSISGLASGIGSVLGGLTAMGEAGKQKGLKGTIGKVAGAAGVVGGVVGVASTVIGLIGGLFHRDKDPGRLRTNKEEFTKAMGGDQAALDHLYALSGRVAPNTGWATDRAREDAYEAYLTALQNNPALHPSGTNTANLRSSAPSVGLAGLGTAVPATVAPVYSQAMSGLDGASGMLQSLMLSRGLPPLPVSTGSQAGSVSSTYSPVWNIAIDLHGIADRDVPQAVVDQIRIQLGRDLQRASAMQGNVALP